MSCRLVLESSVVSERAGEAVGWRTGGGEGFFSGDGVFVFAVVVVLRRLFDVVVGGALRLCGFRPGT